jgi:hypothetical protein
LLVSNDDGAWYSAMVRLIHDGDLRRRIAAAGFDDVRRHRTPASFDETWIAQIHDVMKTRGPRRPLPPAAQTLAGLRPGARVRRGIQRLAQLSTWA